LGTPVDPTSPGTEVAEQDLIWVFFGLKGQYSQCALRREANLWPASPRARRASVLGSGTGVGPPFTPTV